MLLAGRFADEHHGPFWKKILNSERAMTCLPPAPVRAPGLPRE